MILKTFIWGLILGILIFIIALFATPDLTHQCTNTLMICLNDATSKPLWQKMMNGFGCVFSNVWCVLTALF